MKVAMLSPIAWRTPPRHYGPWEQVVSLLTEGLVKRGVDVTLFATADSQTAGKLHAVCPRPYEEDKSIDAQVYTSLHISELLDRADEFDLIHNHFDFLPLTYLGAAKTPTLTTIHGFSSSRILPVFEKYNGRASYVSISDSDRSPKLDYVATVHHGIDLGLFTFREKPGDYLLFFGRIHPDKGAAEAIQIAKAVNRPLVMAGIIHDEDYFKSKIEPHIDGDKVRFLGSAGPEQRDKLLGGALALRHAGHRLQQGLDAGTYPRGRKRLPRLRRGRRGRGIQTNRRDRPEALPLTGRGKLHAGHHDGQLPEGLRNHP